jgi:two-component system, chemotaxis family, chemotaxis protein CheY
MATVLLVDDSATMLMSLKSAVIGAGFQVMTAHDGAAALVAIKERRPDVIVSDVMMANMDGISFVRAARSDVTGRDIPILMLSTEVSRGRRDEARQAGASGWLVKPVDPKNLIRAIRQVLTIQERTHPRKS